MAFLVYPSGNVFSQVLHDTLKVQVYFRQGYSNLDPNYRENGMHLEQFATKVEMFRNQNPGSFRYVKISSSASPEGPSQLNQSLAKRRAASIANYLQPILGDTPYEVFPIENDWDLLDRQVQASDDIPHKDEILDIIRTTPIWIKRNGIVVSGRKKQLMDLHGGKPWNYMYKHFFPDMRNSGASVACVIEISNLGFVELQHTRDSITGIPFPTLGYDSTRIKIPQMELLRPFPIKTTKCEKLVRRHVLALRTNLLYDGFYMPNFGWAPSPNIQLEYYPKSGHFTYNLGFTSPYYQRWNQHKFFQIRDYNIQVRYFFKGHGDFTRWYASAYVHNNKYGIGFSKTKGWQGEGLGAGLTGGYVLPLSKRHPRWRMEFSLGLGFYQTKYDPYIYGNPTTKDEDGLYYYKYTGNTKEFKERCHRFRWLGPSELGVHLTYDLLFKRINKKGISFNRREEAYK